MKQVLIACDKFKGSLTAKAACKAIALGLSDQYPEVAIEICPMADGGEGMSFIITETQNGQFFEKTVTGAMGFPTKASYGIINGTTAVIEMAQASGLDRLPHGVSNDPWQASTAGTGELIVDAANHGATHLLLGIGGSATNDGGTGLAQALGYRFIGSKTKKSHMPTDLLEVTKIQKPSDMFRFESVEVACDVTNLLLGENGCTRVYGPQKGITENQFEQHEKRLSHLIELVENGENLAQQPGAGAAGGLGFGSLAFLNAQLRSGFELVAQAVNLEKKIAKADVVITGEGQIDKQSEQGKVPFGVCQLATKQGKQTYAFCGVNDSSRTKSEFEAIYEIDRQNQPLDEAIKNAAHLLQKTASKAKIF